MPDNARWLRPPLIAAGVAALITVALAVLFFVVVLPDYNDRTSSNSDAAHGQFTKTERTVMNAATIEAENIGTYSRATFDADWNRAIAGATGAFKADFAARKQATLQAITKGKFDVKATVTHAALEGPTDSGHGFIVLVTMNGVQVQGTTQGLPIPQRLALTMVEVGGKWLASDVSQRGLS